MILTPEQQAILNGSKGETMAKVMKTLVMYGETSAQTKWCLSPLILTIWSLPSD